MDGGRTGRRVAVVAAITLGTVALLAWTGPGVAAGRPKPTPPPAPDSMDLRLPAGRARRLRGPWPRTGRACARRRAPATGSTVRRADG